MTLINIKKGTKDHILSLLQDYYYNERGEELGVIGAENLFHFIEKEIAPIVYNLAVEDAKHVIERQWQSVEEELYVLKQNKAL